MKAGKLALSLSLSALVLAGCASTPSAQHLADQNQWQQLGLQDGSQGEVQRSQNELNQLKQISNQSFQEYKKGYAEGLEKFCDVEQGYYQGLTGRQYEGQCSGNSNEQEYIASWEEGFDQYEFEEFDRMLQENDNDRFESWHDNQIQLTVQ